MIIRRAWHAGQGPGADRMIFFFFGFDETPRQKLVRARRKRSKS